MAEQQQQQQSSSPSSRKTIVLSDHKILENHIDSCIHCKKKYDAILNCTKKNIIQLQNARYYREPLVNNNNGDLICQHCHISNHTIENCKKYICGRCSQRGHHENRCKVNVSLYCDYCDKKGHETVKCKRKPITETTTMTNQ